MHNIIAQHNVESLKAFNNKHMIEQENSLQVGIQPSFYSKVLFYFGLAILTSALGTFTGFNYLATLFISNPATIYILYILELVLVFTSRLWSSRKPVNYLLFAAFSFITGVTIVPLLAGVIMSFGGPGIIIKALVSTMLVFSATALFGFVTNRNLSGLRGFLMMSLLGIIGVSIIGLFIPWGSTFEMIFSGFSIVLFAGYTAYDIQRMKMQIDANPMDIALNLYLDMFNLFVSILRLMSNSRN